MLGKGGYWFDFDDHWWTGILEMRRLLAAGKAAERHDDSSTAIASYETLLGYDEPTFLPENLFDGISDPYRNEHEVAQGYAVSRLLRL
ncbi:hypothetical protein D5S17_19790 [Pseudonocardiaceae bacterium YIM PH 21723]|nr:hypothetical protein D5S17_19790 [Pseudonocardiaceae bacterium YIM PH 21723]